MGAALAACCQGSLGTALDCPDGKVSQKLLESLAALKVGPGGIVNIYNFDLHNEAVRAEHLQRYYDVCRQSIGLHVTTSCFTTWRQNKKTNAYGKVIPTTSSSGSSAGPAYRVFFFDDNLELDGVEAGPGICNLRDVEEGHFVDFAEGRNGYRAGRAGRHTVVMHSTEYNGVLVKANILDAIEDHDYFVKIIQQYSLPGEKIIVFMDVNSTIVCNDSVQSKDLSASLLSTMFELMELAPKTAFVMGWGDCKPVSVQKKQSLKKLVKDITASDYSAYKTFFSEDNCRKFYVELSQKADIRWADAPNVMDVEDFIRLFYEYKDTISQGIDSDGITQSWFRCYEKLGMRHSLMLNSFGVDTRKVILATEGDESRVMQIAINYELWDKRDVEKFEAQFGDAPPK